MADGRHGRDDVKNFLNGCAFVASLLVVSITLLFEELAKPGIKPPVDDIFEDSRVCGPVGRKEAPMGKCRTQGAPPPLP